MSATTARTASSSNTAAAAKSAKQVAFFDKRSDNVLFMQVDRKPDMPMFTGPINGKNVALWVHSGRNGVFMGVKGTIQNKETGFYEDLGTANVVTIAGGFPRLVITPKDKSQKAVFLSVSKNVNDQMLVALGMNAAARDAKVAAAQAAKEAKSAEPAAA